MFLGNVYQQLFEILEYLCAFIKRTKWGRLYPTYNLLIEGLTVNRGHY